jgi:hypothetical protein
MLVLCVTALSAALPFVVFSQEAAADRTLFSVETAVFVVFLVDRYVRVSTHLPKHLCVSGKAEDL